MTLRVARYASGWDLCELLRQSSCLSRYYSERAAFRTKSQQQTEPAVPKAKLRHQKLMDVETFLIKIWKWRKAKGIMQFHTT